MAVEVEAVLEVQAAAELVDLVSVVLEQLQVRVPLHPLQIQDLVEVELVDMLQVLLL
jgi:hypothetical protein